MGILEFIALGVGLQAILTQYPLLTPPDLLPPFPSLLSALGGGYAQITITTMGFHALSLHLSLLSSSTSVSLGLLLHPLVLLCLTHVFIISNLYINPP